LFIAILLQLLRIRFGESFPEGHKQRQSILAVLSEPALTLYLS